MSLVARSALAYFALIFALGFVLGTVRTLWLAPAIGPTSAVAAELPVMLAASWLLARRLTRSAELAQARRRAAMGGLAFTLLLSAELLLGVALFGQTPAQWLAALATTPGALGLAGQMLFGLMPLVARRD